MKSLPLNARAETTSLRQPKQVFVFARDVEGGYEFDEAQVLENHQNYYYFPDRQVDANYDLLAGINEFKKIPEEENLGDFEAFLRGLKQHEQNTGEKINSDIVTFRGLMTKILTIPYNMKDPVDLNIVPFDGQLFIKSDPEIELRRREQEKAGIDPKLADFRNRCEYAGYKFEQLTTLPVPWIKASRKDITGRMKKQVNNYEQFMSVVSSKVGDVRTLLAGEVDCVWDYFPDPQTGDKKDNPLQHYVELKTSKLIENPGQVVTFEKKLFKTWAQCFLLGIKRVVYGFRDDGLLLRNVEIYETEEIPLFLKNSTVTTDVSKKINAMSALKWYGAVLKWIRDEIPADSNGAFRLSFDPGSRTFNLEELLDSKKTRDDILSDEFKEWRASLK